MTLLVGIFVLVGCSSDGDADANPSPEVEELEGPPDRLAFPDESEDFTQSDSTDADPVSVADVFSGAGANDDLAQCYANAFADVGVSDITSFEELAQVQRDNDMSAAMAECVDIVNGG